MEGVSTLTIIDLSSLLSIDRLQGVSSLECRIVAEAVNLDVLPKEQVVDYSGLASSLYAIHLSARLVHPRSQVSVSVSLCGGLMETDRRLEWEMQSSTL